MVSTLGDLWVVGFVGLTMTVVCAWPLYRGWQRRDRYRLVRDTPTESPDSATVGDTMFVTGTARRTNATISAPITGEEVLLAVWRIREWQDETLGQKGWTPKARGLHSAAFRLDGDNTGVTIGERMVEGKTGTLTALEGYETVTGIDIDDILVEIETFEDRSEFAREDNPPERLRELERAVGLDEPDGGLSLLDLRRTHGTRRYEQTVVREGDDVTVRGSVTAGAEPGTAPVISSPADGPYIVSNLGPDELARRYRWSFWKLFYGSIAAILVVMGVASLAIAGG